MKVDKRGRVRFTHNGVRVEITKNGVRLYRRIYRLNYNGREFECLDPWAFEKVTSTPEGRAKLEQALATLREHEISNCWYAKARTVWTIIPKHMRAVN